VAVQGRDDVDWHPYPLALRVAMEGKGIVRLAAAQSIGGAKAISAELGPRLKIAARDASLAAPLELLAKGRL